MSLLSSVLLNLFLNLTCIACIDRVSLVTLPLTVCRECIMKKINDDEVDCCPVCSIDLGCDPEEKLR